METNFDDLKKLSRQPAARLLAGANAKLLQPPAVPAAAPPSEMLAAMAKTGALPDMMRVLSVALPARERVWWACLAARDMLPPALKKAPLCLELAESWVRKPVDETREALRDALELAEPDDDSVLCATSALYADDTLGPGDLKQYPAPPGGSQTAAFVMNINAAAHEGDFMARAEVLVLRGLDIARGGNGQIALPPTPPEVADEDDLDEEDAA